MSQSPLANAGFGGSEWVFSFIWFALIHIDFVEGFFTCAVHGLDRRGNWRTELNLRASNPQRVKLQHDDLAFLVLLNYHGSGPGRNP